MLRAGRFRHRLLDEAFLQTHSEQAHQSLTPFLNLWKEGRLQDAEIAAIYIWIFSFLRRPQDFFGGPLSQKLTNDDSLLSAQNAVEILRPTLPAPLQQAKSLKRFEVATSFLHHLCSHSLRSIPFSVNRSLLQWHQGRYPLKLTTAIPSSDEVMQMQTEGCRCVSMLTQKDEFQNFVLEGRDVLGFIIHDLIHADHFFHDQENAQAQIYFAQKLQHVRGLLPIQDMLKNDPQFVTEFEYLMSDMNSVPLHLLKSLKAILLGYFKRRDAVPMSSSLATTSESEFAFLFETVLRPWNFTDQALAAAHRLNTPLYLSPDDSHLLDGELRPKRPGHGAFSLS